jgi:hypothetical protein
MKDAFPDDEADAVDFKRFRLLRYVGTPYSAACCATVGASPATVVRRMSRGWLSS